jgi:putative addiction module component (TIGR02574 family)
MIDIDSLSREERIQLMEKIWKSFAADADLIPVTVAQKQELDRRLAKLDAHGSNGVPAADVFAQLRASRA